MNEELIEILAGLDLDELETQLALQCAPLLTGIKISNMLIVNLKDKEKVIHLFGDSSISFYILYMSDRKVVFLLYDTEKLIQYIHKVGIRKLMILLGYQDYDLISILKELAKRYQGYMQNVRAFPHELGFLLGYPMEDVVGFIVNQGKNPIYTGYWKVYENPVDKLKLFEQYRMAKDMVIRLVAQGEGVQKLLKQYHRNSASPNQYYESILCYLFD